MAGPFGLERQNAYLTWARFAGALAAAGFDAVRIDYRGTGESCGDFRDACLSDWVEDLASGLDSGRPVVVAGLRIGALVASRLFAGGRGDAMLLWDPPASGREALAETLRRRLAADLMEGTPGPRTTREAYIADLEAGNEVEVEGYPWTRRLWADACGFRLEIPGESERRPWRAFVLNRRVPEAFPPGRAESCGIPKPPFWGHAPYVVAELDELIRASLAFLDEAFPGGDGNASD
jgi:pimeloyl-ACP methyl ester carboxylesterase